MSGDAFEKREEGFETKFEREQDIEFRARARRDKRFAKWAAAKMDLPAEEVPAYEAAVIHAAMAETGDQDILAKVSADLTAAGITISDQELASELSQCMLEDENN